MRKYTCVLFGALFLFASCEDMLNEGDGDLSTTDIVKGLKTALNIGTDSSTAILSAKDGYFKDEAVKILLPDEAQYVREKLEILGSVTAFQSATGVIESKLDNLVLAINRSAEEAAKDAKPILSDAITNLTIKDGWDILNGTVPEGSEKSEVGFDSLAATKYLKNQTYKSLVNAYSPKVNSALDQKIVGNASATSLWNDITGKWNGLVEQYNNNNVARAAVEILASTNNWDLNIHEVNTNLGEYTTGKALDGLFLKVGNQEKEIRKNPFQWASDIIQKVFGSISEKINEL